MNKKEVRGFTETLFKFVCNGLGEYRRNKSIYYKPENSFLGVHTDGTYTIVCYEKGFKGGRDIVSPFKRNGDEKMNGFYRGARLNDIIKGSIREINDPGLIFDELAKNSEFIFNCLDFSIEKVINVEKSRSLENKQIANSYIERTLELINEYQNMDKENSNRANMSTVINHENTNDDFIVLVA